MRARSRTFSHRGKGVGTITSTIFLAAAGLSCTARNPASPHSGDVSPGQAALARLSPAPVLPATDAQRQAEAAIDGFFGRRVARRVYVMVDKPLYQPGESIWFRIDLRDTRTMIGNGNLGATVQLVDPRGSVVAQKRVLMQQGAGANDFQIPEEAPGGEFKVRVTGDDGTAHERAIVVQSYEAPRLKKTLEFVKKAYGPGDTVSAALAVARATGEPFGKKNVTAVVTVDDAEVSRAAVSLDAEGKATVKFALPAAIGKGDGLLTILADDGGVVESIQKRIPILLKDLDFAMFPEGGDLVAGLPGRVYFSAKNTIGKPADVDGRVVDDAGHEVARFSSVHDGMGRFELTPTVGRSYRVEITRPAGIAHTFDVPAAKSDGCALQALDDFDSKRKDLRVVAWCTKADTVLLEATLRERRIGGASVELAAKRPAMFSLPIDAADQGAVRVTLFDGEKNPVAERLLYHGRGRDMKVAITSDKPRYSPRDPVTLTVKTTDLAGKPVQADLGLAVVDDTVLSFADDKEANILAALYLTPELGTDPIEEPNFYFGDKPEAAAAMDLLMGTRGWRRFEWQLVFNPPPPPPDYARYDAEMEVPAAMPVPADQAAPVLAPAPPRGVVAAEPLRKAGVAGGAAAPAGGAPRPLHEARMPVVANNVNVMDQDNRGPRRAVRLEQDKKKDEAWGGEDDNQQWGWAPVRVFPAPKYEPGYDGPRTDFRETLHWAPEVKTGADGTAQVTFYLSDAVTSFRAIAEGGSAGGMIGRGEAVIQSKMPLSLDARLPLEVSAGDKISLPVTLTNETDHRITGDLKHAFGSAFSLTNVPWNRPISLEAGEKKTFLYELTVTGQEGEGEVELAVETAGLRDEIRKKIRVVPLGFPFEVGAAGTLRKDAPGRHAFDLTGALPGSVHATVTMYPSPLATMVQGAAAMIREPGGCFEQTSATNYPNVMVLSYLEKNDAADPALVQRAGTMLDHGYKLLTGYETKEKGYEWFGENPGHEALTAYGLMEFADMQHVYSDVDRAMIERTADWLMKRRDGKGGFERNSKALDSFGRAGYETTNAYIMWALSEAGRAKGLDKELGVQRRSGLESKDPYLVALAANTMLNAEPDAADTDAIVKRLAGMQGKDGGFTGAKETITMSGGEALTIETTSLAVMALIKGSPKGEHEDALRSGVEWLNGHRGGWGQWGSTQGTVLSLRALSAYADHSRQTQAAGKVTLVINGKEAGSLSFEKGQRDALVFDDLAGNFVAGPNTVEIRLDGEATLPYSVAIEYRAARPQSSERAKVNVTTKLAKAKVPMGEGVKLRAHIENKTHDGVPMTLARVGIPGGLTFQTWQLKELRDKKIIDFYETRQREVILYFRALPPDAKKDIDLDLLAAVPGTFVAPATSAYLYYTDEDKSWAPPVTVTVTR